MVKITVQGPRPKKEERTLEVEIDAPILFSGEYTRGKGKEQYILGFFQDFRNSFTEKPTPKEWGRGHSWRKPKITVSHPYRLRKSRTLEGVEIPLMEWEGDKERYSLNGTPEIYSGQEEIVKFLSGREGFRIYADFVRRMRIGDNK